MNNIDLLKNKAKELMTTETEFIDSVSVELTDDPDYGWGDDQQLGKYLPLQNKIKLFNEFRKYPNNPQAAVDTIFPTYYHELIHALQRRECGLILYLLALFFWRSRLERDARELEDQMYKLN